MTADITVALARHAAAARFEDLPPEAVAAAKRSLLDAVGVMIAASGLEPACRAFADQAREQGGPGQSTVLGYGFKAPALMAAFANGALAHALDFEDAFDGAPIHPNAPTIPAALAVAEARGGVSGKELIAAVAVGCDVVCRLGLAFTENLDVYGFYPPPILGAFGAATAAGRLLGLDERGFEDAFALTLSQSIATAQFKTTPDSTIRAVRDAFAAQAGVQAAQLAARGVRGFGGVFEGKHGFYALYARGAYDPAVILDRLGREFRGADVSFKPWPACRGTHAFIEAAQALAAQHQIRADQVAHMTLTASPMMAMLAEPFEQKTAPTTAIDAKFSLAFTVATELVHGAVNLASFSREALADPRVLDLARRSTFVPDPAAPPGMAGMTSGTLTLSLTDGRTVEARVERPRGHPSNPMSDAELRRKFLDCSAFAARPVSPEGAVAFADRVARLEAEDDVTGLLQGL